MGFSLMVTVLGPFGLGDPDLAGGRRGVFGADGVVRGGDFDGILGFGFMAFAT